MAIIGRMLSYYLSNGKQFKRLIINTVQIESFESLLFIQNKHEKFRISNCVSYANGQPLTVSPMEP